MEQSESVWSSVLSIFTFKNWTKLNIYIYFKKYIYTPWNCVLWFVILKLVFGGVIFCYGATVFGSLKIFLVTSQVASRQQPLFWWWIQCIVSFCLLVVFYGFVYCFAFVCVYGFCICENELLCWAKKIGQLFKIVTLFKINQLFKIIQ